MKKLFVAAAALLISLSGFAQNQNLDYKVAFKASSTLTYKFFSYYSTLEVGEQFRNQMIQPGIGVEWLSKNQNSHAVYVNGAYRSFPNLTDINAVHQHYSAGYNYFVNFNKGYSAKVVPSVGAGLNLYHETFEANYYREGGISEFNIVGAKAMLTPRMLYFASPRVFIDVNLPVCLADITYGDSYSEYSGCKYTSQNKFSTDAFPKIVSLQVGFGIKL